MKNSISVVVVVIAAVLSFGCSGGSGLDESFGATSAPPEVVLSGITDGETYGELVSGPNTLNIRADATDDVGVGAVSIYIDGSLVAFESDDRATYRWDTAGLANGAYVIFAQAIDDESSFGNDSMTVYIDNGIFTPPGDDDILHPEDDGETLTVPMPSEDLRDLLNPGLPIH